MRRVRRTPRTPQRARQRRRWAFFSSLLRAPRQATPKPERRRRAQAWVKPLARSRDRTLPDPEVSDIGEEALRVREARKSAGKEGNRPVAHWQSVSPSAFRESFPGLRPAPQCRDSMARNGQALTLAAETGVWHVSC
jgi:hypothetical protein